LADPGENIAAKKMRNWRYGKKKSYRGCDGMLRKKSKDGCSGLLVTENHKVDAQRESGIGRGKLRLRKKSGPTPWVPQFGKVNH